MRLPSLDRPPRALDPRVVLTLLFLLLVAAALLLAIRTPSTSTGGGSSARGHETPGQASPRGALDVEQASVVARHFLRAYLSVLYGHAPRRVLPGAAPGIAASIAKRGRVPVALRRLHPRIVSVTAAPAGETGAEITARISDGEVVTYRLRLLLARSSDGQLVVAKVGAG